MKITKTEKVLIDNISIINTICNRCGDTIPFDLGDPTFAPVQEFKLVFGYGSYHDGEYWAFDLCDDCLDTITKDFKVAVEIQYPI